MHILNNRKLTEKQHVLAEQMLSDLSNSKLTVEANGTEEATNIMNLISEFLGIPLYEIKYNRWFGCPIISHNDSTVIVELRIISVDNKKQLDFCFLTSNHDCFSNSHYTANDIERIITSDEEMNNTDSPSMKLLLREFATTYGIELSVTPDGWLVVDGTNEAVLTDVELVRYMAAYESIKDIMLKFER